MPEKMTIRQARRLAEKTQRQVATAIGMHEITYRKIENHPEEARLKDLQAISNFLNVPMDDLILSP